jgi:hypothetical protein
MFTNEDLIKCQPMAKDQFKEHLEGLILYKPVPKPKEICILSKPIEILPLENFKVIITLPSFFEKKCSCDIKVLMALGCQCGGS